jgi:hypothetical protein
MVCAAGDWKLRRVVDQGVGVEARQPFLEFRPKVRVDGKTTPRVASQQAAAFGLLDQVRVRLLYPVVKRRDVELTLQGRDEATDERIDTLAIMPPTPLNLDRTRVLRGGFDGVWRLREAGTTISYGALLSQGLDAFGARTNS